MDDSEVLGKAGDLELKAGDLRKSLKTLSEAERAALRREPASLNQYVRALIIQQAVLREAAASGWDKNPVVEERMRLMRDGIVASTYLESIAQAPEGYPTEADLKAAYDANRTALALPKSWRLAQIFVTDPVPEGIDPATAEASANAATKLARVRQALAQPGADFAELAVKESDEPASAARGGEIGWLYEPQIHPAVRAALPSMQLNQVSEPLRMPDGWHFVRVLDIREAYTPTLDQIRDSLAQRLRAERARLETQAFIGRLLQQNPVAINEMALSKLIPATPTP